MGDELSTILRLVAEGQLSAEEAAPIIEALTARRPAAGPRGEPPRRPEAARPPGGPSRRVRIQVSERGHRVVDLRVPLSFAALAARAVPGMPASYASLIERAVQSETLGTIVETEDDNGDRVLITLE